MTKEQAIDLIRPGIRKPEGHWADIGAGTGLFTQALCAVLGEGSRVYAVDKSPHALWDLASDARVEIEVVEADFHEVLDLPPLDGIVMANALHYAKDHMQVLQHVAAPLKSGGTLILVEYDTETPRPPWVPNPVSLRIFQTLCPACGLSEPEVLGSTDSRYGYDRIYVAVTWKY